MYQNGQNGIRARRRQHISNQLQIFSKSMLILHVDEICELSEIHQKMMRAHVLETCWQLAILKEIQRIIPIDNS